MNKRFKQVAGIGVLVFLMIFTGASAGAQGEVIDEDISKSFGDLEVHAGTTVNGNVSLSMGSATIMGVVNGDVSADMGEISVLGTVNGDVKADMGKVVINGDVTGNVAATMGEVVINGTIGGDVKSKLGTVRITGTVNGDVISELGDINIAGEVGGNVKSEGKRIVVNGTVGGDIDVYRGMVELGSDSVVHGKVFVEEGLVNKREGARAGAVEVQKELTEEELRRLYGFPGGISFRGLGSITEIFRDGGFWRHVRVERFVPRDVVPFFQFDFLGIYGRIWQRIITIAILFALGVLVYTLFPRQTEKVREAAESSTGTVVAWGIIALLAAIPLMILLAITIIGILLIPVVILAFAVAWILGYTGITFLLGDRILETSKSDSDNPFIKILIGVALLGLISFIPIAGPLVSVAVMIVGVGASLFTRFGSNTQSRV